MSITSHTLSQKLAQSLCHMTNCPDTHSHTNGKCWRIELTDHEAKEGPDLPSLWRRDLNVNIDVETGFEGGGTEGGERREVVWSCYGTQSLQVMLPRLQVSLPASYLLGWGCVSSSIQWNLRIMDTFLYREIVLSSEVKNVLV